MSSTKGAIPETTISRIIRDICRDLGYKIRVDAVSMLHECTENFLIELFSAANAICTHAERHTLRSKDIQVAIEIAKKLNIKDLKFDVAEAFNTREDHLAAESPRRPEQTPLGLHFSIENQQEGQKERL